MLFEAFLKEKLSQCMKKKVLLQNLHGDGLLPQPDVVKRSTIGERQREKCVITCDAFHFGQVITHVDVNIIKRVI